jgi:hypothetical protein
VRVKYPRSENPWVNGYATINSLDFRKDKPKRATTCGTLIIPLELICEAMRLRFSPESNLNFWPGNERHFDGHTNDVQTLARLVLLGINQGKVYWSFLDAKNRTYSHQAVIVFSSCSERFGELKPEAPPRQWIDGKDLGAQDQIRILCHLASDRESIEPS